MTKRQEYALRYFTKLKQDPVRYQRYLTKDRARRKKNYQKAALNPEWVKLKAKRNYEYCHSEHGKAVYRAARARRRAAIKLRIPKWVGASELQQIAKFYKNCPEGYHVDHIVPLQGNIVSGFHTLANLQYLTASENCRKHNKLLAAAQA